MFEGLKKLTCYPPDHFAFLQADNEDELVPSFSAAFSNINPDILASADEDGIMRFFDTRKALSNGFVSGKTMFQLLPRIDENPKCELVL